MYELSSGQVLATSYTMMAISGIAILLRFFLRWLRGDPLQLEDGFMIFAFVSFYVLATITIILIPTAYRIIAVGENLLPEDDEGLHADEVFQLKVNFASNILFPMVLWSVKLSLLSLSRRILNRQPEWLRAWWMILGFVVLTYIGCLLVTFASCTTVSDYFTPGACNTDRDVRGQAANLYYVVVAEILTDMLIMALPIIFLHQARLTRRTYLRTAAIFSVGVVCIITALCRGITIGTRVDVNTPTFPWLAIWEMIEGGIAVIVGCLPTYAVYFIQSSKSAAERSTAAAYARRSLGGDDRFKNWVTTKVPGQIQRISGYYKNRHSRAMAAGNIVVTRNVEFETESVAVQG